MIKYILILSIGLSASCEASKQIQTVEVQELVIDEVAPEAAVVYEVNEISSDRPMREEDMIGIQGTVRINDKGCPVYIEMIEGDLFSLVYPVNLGEKFKVDGKKIVFSFLPSRAQSVEGCEVKRVVSVSEVKEI